MREPSLPPLASAFWTPFVAGLVDPGFMLGTASIKTVQDWHPRQQQTRPSAWAKGAGGLLLLEVGPSFLCCFMSYRAARAVLSFLISCYVAGQT